MGLHKRYKDLECLVCGKVKKVPAKKNHRKLTCSTKCSRYLNSHRKLRNEVKRTKKI